MIWKYIYIYILLWDIENMNSHDHNQKFTNESTIENAYCKNEKNPSNFTLDFCSVAWSKWCIWFGFFVQWYINLCELFDAKAFLVEEQQEYLYLGE